MKSKKLTPSLAILVSIVLIGCDATPQNSSTTIPEAPAGPGVVNVVTDDPEMPAAKAKAENSSTTIPKAPAGSGVINVATDDPEMAAAKAKAKKTMSYFEENWESDNFDSCSVKFSLPTNSGDREHIWFTPTKIDGDSFTGTCGNDPLDIPNLAYGDTRTVDRADVTDWMLTNGAMCYGGYTIRVLVARNPEGAPPLKFMDHEE